MELNRGIYRVFILREEGSNGSFRSNTPRELSYTQLPRHLPRGAYRILLRGGGRGQDQLLPLHIILHSTKTRY